MSNGVTSLLHQAINMMGCSNKMDHVCIYNYRFMTNLYTYVTIFFGLIRVMLQWVNYYIASNLNKTSCTVVTCSVIPWILKIINHTSSVMMRYQVLFYYFVCLWHILIVHHQRVTCIIQSILLYTVVLLLNIWQVKQTNNEFHMS